MDAVAMMAAGAASRQRWSVGIVGGLAGLLVVVAAGVFDAFLWSLAVPVVVVTLVGAATASARPVVRASAAIVGMVLGVVGAVVASGGSPGDVLTAVGDGPRQLLSTEWPSPAVPSVVGAVAVVLALTTGVAAELAVRARFHLAPLAVITVGWVVLLGLGAPLRPPMWVLGVGAVLAVVLTIVGADPERDPRDVVLRLDRTVAVSAVAIVVVGAGTAAAVDWVDRADPRRTDDAETTLPILDPIEATVALQRAVPEFELFAIIDRSTVVGQSLPARWRVGAVTVYDGQRWVPRVELRPIGGRLGLPEDRSVTQFPAIRYALEYRSDDIASIPLPGPPLDVDVDVETDVDRVVVRPLVAPVVGDTVVVESDVAVSSRAGFDGLPVRRSVDEIAAAFTDSARRLGGEGTQLEQIRRIETVLREEWQLDAGAPGAGQQRALIERFVMDTNRGTEEQFVTGFVLLVRSLGVEARVATGFVVPPDSLASPLALRSEMAAVWPEVLIEGAGWVAFDPVPASETGDDDSPPPQPQAQTPAAAQPPIAPPADADDDLDDDVVQISGTTDAWSGLQRWVIRIATVAGTAVLPIVIAVAAVVALKTYRRRRRRNHPDPAERIRGVWASVTDSLVDAGMTIAPSWTDDHIASSGARLAPRAGNEIRRLAAMSSEVTFGSARRAEQLAPEALASAAAVDDAIAQAHTRWQRIRWWINPRSLRRSTRSPLSKHPNA